MRRQEITILLVVMLLFGAAGCSAYMSSFQSSFFANFSLRELVEKNKSIAGLSCSVGAGGGGGGGGMSMGTGGVGKQGSNFNKHESFVCQISDAKLFDEAKFMETLKQNIEQDLDANKARFDSGKNVDANSFHVEYKLSDNVTGTLKILAKKGPMHYYTLQADLSEKSKY